MEGSLYVGMFLKIKFHLSILKKKRKTVRNNWGEMY